MVRRGCGDGAVDVLLDEQPVRGSLQHIEVLPAREQAEQLDAKALHGQAGGAQVPLRR